MPMSKEDKKFNLKALSSNFNCQCFFSLSAYVIDLFLVLKKISTRRKR